MGSVKPDRASQEPEGKAHQRGVPKVKKSWGELCNLQLCDEIEDGIGENVDGRSARDYKTAPPPMIILHTTK